MSLVIRLSLAIAIYGTNFEHCSKMEKKIKEVYCIKKEQNIFAFGINPQTKERTFSDLLKNDLELTVWSEKVFRPKNNLFPKVLGIKKWGHRKV